MLWPGLLYCNFSLLSYYESNYGSCYCSRVSASMGTVTFNSQLKTVSWADWVNILVVTMVWYIYFAFRIIPCVNNVLFTYSLSLSLMFVLWCIILIKRMRPHVDLRYYDPENSSSGVIIFSPSIVQIKDLFFQLMCACIFAPYEIVLFALNEMYLLQ